MKKPNGFMKKIYKMAKEANDEQYNFNLYFSNNHIQYSNYEKEGKYDWHIDIGSNEKENFKKAKLFYIIK